jgi:outer membrane protein assembly factor BamB
VPARRGPAPGTVQWRAPGIQYATALSVLAGPGNTVLAGSLGGDPDDCGFPSSVVALDRTSGRPAWSYRAKGKYSFHIAGVAAGLAFVYDVDTGTDTSCGDDAVSTIRAVDERGRVQWRLAVPASDEPGPTVIGADAGVVVVSDLDGLVGVDAASGRVLWHRDETDGFDDAELVDGVVVASGVVDAHHSGVMALDVRDGRQRWALTDGYHYFNFESTYRDLVFVTASKTIGPGSPGALTAYRAETGLPAWTTDIVVDGLGDPVQGEGDVVLVERPEGIPAALDVATGNVRPDLDSYGFLLPGATCGFVSNQYGAGSSGDHISVRDFGGARRWESSLGMEAKASDGHSVYASTSQPGHPDAFVALDCANGREQWRHVLQRGSIWDAITVPGGVIVAAEGAIYRFAA